MSISGFTFIHNAIQGGYPIAEAVSAVMSACDEIVVVDMQSTDGTRDILKKLGCRILDGWWIPGGGDHACLNKNWALYKDCKCDHILHFEADEVYSPELAYEIHKIHKNATSHYVYIHVNRIQVEQNFQRIRWYPTYVHRFWPKVDATIVRMGHTTSCNIGDFVDVTYGYLWDVTYNFRDNYLARCKNNAELHGGEPNYMLVPYHFTLPVKLTAEEMVKALLEPHWEWKSSPFKLPESLAYLVGVTKYIPRYDL